MSVSSVRGWGLRLNMALDLQRLFGLYVHSCTHWLRRSQLPTSPRIWAHIRGRYWSATIDDIFCHPLGGGIDVGVCIHFIKCWKQVMTHIWKRISAKKQNKLINWKGGKNSCTASMVQTYVNFCFYTRPNSAARHTVDMVWLYRSRGRQRELS
jgi:hypothetical protein